MSLRIDRARKLVGEASPKELLSAYQPFLADARLKAADWIAIGDAAHHMDDILLALRAYESAVQLAPKLPRGRIGYANVLDHIGRREEALREYEEALRLGASGAEFLLNFGATLAASDDFARAELAYDQAVAQKPDFGLALMNRGNLKSQTGRYVEGFDDLKRAFRLMPLSGLAEFNYGLACLRLGDWINGFHHYEARWRVLQADYRPPRQLWAGQPLSQGMSILVYGEQGLGDMIMFARLIPLLADFGCKVVIRSPRPIRRLLETLDPRVSVYANDEQPPHSCDYVVPAASLPAVMRLTPRDIPRPPYFNLERFPSRGRRTRTANGERVGIIWKTGALSIGAVRGRSIPLPSLLAQLPESAAIVCLQKDVERHEMDLLVRRGAEVPDVGDFLDTAEIMKTCDRIVSVDTAAAHLAGAIGADLDILLPFFSDWRWGLPSVANAWYPDARLHRQIARADWTNIFSTL